MFTVASPFLFLALLLSVLSVAVATTDGSTCGPDPSKAPVDCDRPDFGSCGNACCVVDCIVKPHTYDVSKSYATIADFLTSGGADGSFAYSSGPDSAGHDPSPDLRPYNISAKYIFQGTHKTIGGYVDTLDFAVYADGPSTRNEGTATSRVRAFSVSDVHGALGDGGQNYKTLAYLFDSISTSFVCDELSVVHGCGKK